MEHLEVQKEEKETGRLEAFSDGVFAIATTLLVLDLKDPDAAVTGGSPAQLAKALLRQWPNYIGLVTSYVGAPSRDCAECLQDGCVTSFRQRLPTAWRGVRSLPDFHSGIVPGNSGSQDGAVFYSGPFVFMAVCFFLFIRAAFRKPLLSKNASEEFISKTCHNHLFRPPAYVLATLGALLDVCLCLAMCTILWIFWATTITKNTRA
jgi:hypothetical protein